MPTSAFTKRYEQFCRSLVAARKAAGMTQAELAAKLRLPQSFVSKYERGERRLDVVEFLRVTEILGADPHAVLDTIRPPQTKPRN
jgi:transcriptional regulator with XRE-family HTH domain